MNSITVFGLALCLAQILSSMANHNKITKDEFGFPGLKQGFHPLQVLRRSKRATQQKSYVLFDNRSGRQIQLWWKGKGRKDERYRILGPGEALTTETFVTHQWSATDKITNQRLLIDNKSYRYTPRRNTPETRDIVVIRRQGQNNVEIGDKYIETMVVVDKSVAEYHKNEEEVKRYVSYVLKLASQVFQHSSLSNNFGVKITVVLSKLVILEDDKKEIVIKQYSDFKRAGNNLDSVCSYMNKIGNKGRVKFDHKLFLTRKKFGYSGLGRRYGMCSQYQSCSLVLDVGFSSSIVVAHEIAHLLGSDDLKYGRDSKFIMAKPVTARLNYHAWSTDSKVSILLNIRKYSCLNNKPSMDNKLFPTLHKYPGVYYSLVKQCQLEYNMNHTYWKASEPCTELKCQLPPPYSDFYYLSKLPALDGSECGTNKWCLSGSCQRRIPLPTIERSIPTNKKAPVHGKWGAWKAWTPCSKTCGPGISIRVRECNNPEPRDGGRSCVGASQHPKGCRVKDCPKKVLNDDNLCSKEGIKHDRNRQWGSYSESKVNLNCDFERDTCSWKNDERNDQQDWELNKGKTQSSRTGPSEDHTKKTKQGQYIYFESSTPMSLKGYQARLSSGNLAVPQACLTFWYHMYGEQGMGSLTVTKSSRDITRTLWIKTGNQGNKWMQGQVEIEDDSLYQINFVAKKLFNGYKSDIALDSITFTSGPCDQSVQKKSTHERCYVTCTTVDNASPKKIIRIPTNYAKTRQGNCRNVGCDGISGSGKKYDSCGVCGGNGQSCKENAVDCNFEKDSCQWKNVRKSNNDLYWLRRKGEGYYMFVETSNHERQGKLLARLESPDLHLSKACLTFDYQMNGINIIKLRVRMYVNSRLDTSLRWSRKMQRGSSQWLKARVNINRASTRPYKVVIEGLVGNRKHGDIAVDNIQFRKGNCR